MSQFKFTFDGVPFEAETAAGAAELFRALRGGTTIEIGANGTSSGKKAAKKQQKLHKPATEEEVPSFPEWAPDSAIKFLTAIRNASAQGAPSETMMKALGITAPKALGGRSAIINKLIAAAGYTQGQVYDNKRTSAGRFWRARKHLPDVITYIQTHFVRNE